MGCKQGLCYDLCSEMTTLLSEECIAIQHERQQEDKLGDHFSALALEPERVGACTWMVAMQMEVVESFMIYFGSRTVIGPSKGFMWGKLRTKVEGRAPR